MGRLVETNGNAGVMDDLIAFSKGVREVGPTVREFMGTIGVMSTHTADYRLKRLEREGLIAKWDETGLARGYRLTDKGRAVLSEAQG